MKIQVAGAGARDPFSLETRPALVRAETSAARPMAAEGILYLLQVSAGEFALEKSFSSFVIFLQVFFLIQTTITGNNSCLVWQIFQSIDHAHYGRLCTQFHVQLFICFLLHSLARTPLNTLKKKLQSMPFLILSQSYKLTLNQNSKLKIYSSCN